MYVLGNVQTGSEALTVSCLICMGGNFLAGAVLANHHGLVSRLGMSGAIAPIPHVFTASTEKKIIEIRTRSLYFTSKTTVQMSTTFGITTT